MIFLAFLLRVALALSIYQGSKEQLLNDTETKSSIVGSTAKHANFGTLTWYLFNGGPAYCDGKPRGEYELVVALHSYTLNQYDCHSEHRSIQINAPNGGSVIAAVVDMCDVYDGCVPGTVDGTMGVWSALGLDLSIGRLDITWQYV